MCILGIPFSLLTKNPIIRAVIMSVFYFFLGIITSLGLMLIGVLLFYGLYILELFIVWVIFWWMLTDFLIHRARLHRPFLAYGLRLGRYATFIIPFVLTLQLSIRRDRKKLEQKEIHMQNKDDKPFRAHISNETF